MKFEHKPAQIKALSLLLKFVVECQRNVFVNKIDRRRIIKKNFKHYLNITISALVNELKVELSKNKNEYGQRKASASSKRDTWKFVWTVKISQRSNGV